MQEKRLRIEILTAESTSVWNVRSKKTSAGCRLILCILNLDKRCDLRRIFEDRKKPLNDIAKLQHHLPNIIFCFHRHA